MRRWKKLGIGNAFADGWMVRAGERIVTPEEATVFQAARVRYIEPQARFAAADVEAAAL
jgi:hypothetical protein